MGAAELMGINVGEIGDFFENPGESISGIDDAVNDAVEDIGGAVSDALEAQYNFFIGEPLSALQDWLVPEVELPDVAASRLNGTLLTRSGTVVSIPVIYGEDRVGGILVFEAVSGNDNEFLHQVIVWCEGEISAVDEVLIDDLPSTDAKYAGLVRVRNYTGTDTQIADPDLVAEVPEWTTAHEGRGVAYTYLRLRWDGDVFRGRPKVQADIRGRKVFDPRKGLTNWSANPALCVRDYISNSRYGLGIPDTDINEQSIKDGADYCETARIPYTDAPAQDLYRCDGVVDTGRRVRDNVVELLGACRGFLPPTGGLYTLILDKDETPSFTFDETNIIGGWSIAGVSKRDRYNRVEATYKNPDIGSQADLAIKDSTIFRAEDNGLLLEKRLTLPYTNDVYRATDMAELELKQSRQQIRVSFTATVAALQVAIGEVVYITHATPGWVNKTFRVTRLDLSPSGNVVVNAREHEPTVYDLDLQTEAPTPPDSLLPDPNVVPVPTGLVLDSGTGALLQNSDGTLISRVHTTWDRSPNIYVVGYEVQLQVFGEGVWLPVGATHSHSDVELYIAPVRDGDIVRVRVRAVNAMGFHSDWLTSADHVVQGKLAPPSNVTGFEFVIDNGAVKFSWNAITDVDALDYEIREGNAWDTAAFAARVDSTSYIHTAVLTGTTRYLIKARDTSQQYSASAAAVDVVIVPLSAPQVSAQVVDNNVLLSWTDSTGTLPVNAYELRRGTDLTTADVIGAVTANFSVIFETTAGTYVYWVVPIDTAGNEGAASSIAVTVDQPPDFVLRAETVSDFSATKTNALNLGDRLLVPVNTHETWEQHFVNNGWMTIQDHINAGYNIYATPSVATGAYEEEIDYGVVMPGTRVALTIQTIPIVGSVTVTPTISVRETTADPWTDFTGVWEVYATNFRYVKIRLDFAGTGTNDLLALCQLSVRLDVKLKDDNGKGTANSADPSGTTVNFNVAFLDVESITVTPTGTSPRYAVYDFVDTPNPVSFSVYLFDQNGSRVSGDFSWTAKGF